MEKTESMIIELKTKGITVCAVVTDSAGAYAAARYIFVNVFFLVLLFKYLNINISFYYIGKD